MTSQQEIKYKKCIPKAATPPATAGPSTEGDKDKDESSNISGIIDNTPATGPPAGVEEDLPEATPILTVPSSNSGGRLKKTRSCNYSSCNIIE
jgi:hypothetical protein